ncbi:MAG TPA: DEAD/DEAH box helicase [Bacteroidales bacterium]|nr:DEAD/DEAH box helicase [Bacteroidales bacterium]
MSFQKFGFEERILLGIEAMNYHLPTPVQEQVIPCIMAGKDVIASAQTGTGKTAAFLLPVLNRIVSNRQGDFIKCLIVVPTRELAIQISQHIEGFSYFVEVSSLAVFGGSDGAVFSNEKRALTQGADIAVCTPGRLISHLNLGYVKLDQIQVLVLDEADRMLDMGFLPDIQKIISYIPKKPQTLFFSATMPPRIRDLARKILVSPSEINIGLATPPAKIIQQGFKISEDKKIFLVNDLISSGTNFKSILVFCHTKAKVKELSRSLKKTQASVEEIHSDLGQSEREATLNRFKSRQTRVLVATDILARGIDVEDIDLVINYSVPYDAEDYVHRIGRTARVQADGHAFTLISPMEHRRFNAIEKFLGYEIPKLPLPETLVVKPQTENKNKAGTASDKSLVRRNRQSDSRKISRSGRYKQQGTS